jgi:chemotaxis protein MotA
MNPRHDRRARQASPDVLHNETEDTMPHAARYALPLACIATVIIAALFGDGVASFIHPPSLILTVGGTALVTLLSFPRAQLDGLVTAIRQAIAGDKNAHSEIEQVKELARRHRVDGIPGLERNDVDISNQFLRRGVELLLEWKSPDETRERLEGEHLRAVTHYEDCRRILLTIGKLLPAFGLIGTLASLVLLLRNPAELSADRVAPALSLAILTTLYGAVLANAVVLPLEAKLQTFTDHLRIRFEVAVRGTQLILDRAYPSAIEEQLSSIIPEHGTEAAAADADRTEGLLGLLRLERQAP